MTAKCPTAPFFRFGRHKWQNFTNHDFVAPTPEALTRFIMGSHLRREIRICACCPKREFRDVFGGKYIPRGWEDHRFERMTPWR